MTKKAIGAPSDMRNLTLFGPMHGGTQATCLERAGGDRTYRPERAQWRQLGGAAEPAA
jgi:hypothetical protein